jgi:2-polyprenyl-3-methyl-5-hydroxy-6-metoxy-1,4-benzoquinol methylase
MTAVSEQLASTDSEIEELNNPDRSAVGFVKGGVDPLRYDGQKMDPDEVAGVLAAFVPTKGRLLDVGCGTGSVTKLVADVCGVEVLGIEPDARRASVAQKRGLNVRVGVLSTEIIEKIGTFDTVMFADVLEHVADPGALLGIARSVLKTGGCVVASVPNVAHWTVRLDILRGRFRYESCGIMDATHLRWFTEEGVRLLFDAAGFRIVEHRVTAGFELPAYFSRRPWRWMRSGLRNRIVRKGIRVAPSLFGCQHVIKAIPV